MRYQYPQPEGVYYAPGSIEALADEQAATARELLQKSVQLELSRLAVDDGSAGGQTAYGKAELIEDLYTLLDASTTPAVGEVLQETISFVHRAGVSAEAIGRLEDVHDS
eukprot:COSAG06_NODE_44182_length_365_cov_1.421053_1_plen_108_part_01